MYPKSCENQFIEINTTKCKRNKANKTNGLACYKNAPKWNVYTHDKHVILYVLVGNGSSLWLKADAATDGNIDGNAFRITGLLSRETIGNRKNDLTNGE